MKRVISTILTVLMIISMLSTFAFAETVSGSCGENASWNFDTTSGVLTISGTGAINHYSYLTPPGGSYKKSIKTK